MKSILIKATIVAFFVAPAVVYGQSRENIRSSSPYNGSAGRVSDKDKAKAAAEKFNGQREEKPQKPKVKSPQQPLNGPVENGSRVKQPQSTTSK